MATYDFVIGTPADRDVVRQLIDGRITWLEEQGIDQWPREAYWYCYSEEYFLDCARDNRLLNACYRDLGYAYPGKLYEEDYTGNKYQKFLGGCI